MIVYIVATLLSCALAWYAQRQDGNVWLRVASALPLAMVAAVRWGVGTDMYFLYLPQFTAVEWFRAGGGAELAREYFQPLMDGTVCPPLQGDPLALAETFWRNFNLEEPGYRALFHAIVWCGGSFRWFTIITSLATAALVFSVIWRQSRAPALAVYFYVATSNYFLSLNIVRQYFAIGLVLLAVSYAADRRFWRFVLCLLVAVLFHKSAILVFPIWFIPMLRIRPWYGFLFVVLALGASVVISPVLRMALPYVGLGIYVKYFETSHAQDGFEWMFFAINIAFMAMGIFYFARAIAKNHCFAIWYWMTVLGTVALAFSGTVPLMKRVNYYFAGPQFLMLPEMLMAEEKPWLRRWLTLLAILAFAAETFVAVFLMNKNEPLPYHVCAWGVCR